MKTYYVKSQKELDKLVSINLDDEIDVIIQTKKEDNLIITKTGINWNTIIDTLAYVRVMRENSQVGVMRENSQVGVMRENSQVGEMRENSQVRVMRGNSQVGVMRENSQVRVMRENSQVGEMRENSQVKKLLGYACVLLMYSSSIINSFGYNTIRYYETEKGITINKNKYTTIIKLPTIQKNNNIEFYQTLYPVEKKGSKLIMYKSVHKINGEYISDYDNSFKYVIGETITHDIDKQDNNSCSKGLHISDKSRAILFGLNWEDIALLECEVSPRDIIVSKDCDGKVRTSKLKVLREVPKEEFFI